MENNNFEWTVFYNELAHSLLKYKDNRKDLLSFIYNDLDSKDTKYLHEAEEVGDNASDLIISINRLIGYKKKNSTNLKK